MWPWRHSADVIKAHHQSIAKSKEAPWIIWVGLIHLKALKIWNLPIKSRNPTHGSSFSYICGAHPASFASCLSPWVPPAHQVLPAALPAQPSGFQTGLASIHSHESQILVTNGHIHLHIHHTLPNGSASQGSPCGSAGEESACNAGDLGLIPGFRKMPWRRESLPTPVFWPGEFRGLYISPWGHKESDTTGQLPPAQAEAQLTQENRKGMLLLKATKYLIQVLSRPQWK